MTRHLVRSLTLLLAAVALHGVSARAEDTLQTGGATHEEKKKAAPAEDQTPPADAAAMDAAKQVLQQYLDAVKTAAVAKKKPNWDAAKKLTHPRTLEVIAEIKARTGSENHALAPWAKLKEQYVTGFQLGTPQPTANGAVVVPSTEEIFDVPDKGTEPDVKAEYLLIPLGGKWYVADRRLGEGQFPKDTVGEAYKGYFEGQYVPKEPEEPAKPAKKGKKH